MSQLTYPTSSVEPINSVQPTQLTQSTQGQGQRTPPKRIDPPSGTQEMWASLEPQGFPKYEVSTFGRVRNAKRKNILKGAKTDTDYAVVAIPDQDGVQRKPFVEVLVATAFLENPEGKPTVDHIDRIRNNNYVGNLRWATLAEQSANRCEYHRSGRPIYQYSLDGTLIRRWNEAAEASSILGISSGNIRSVCNSNRQTAGGYRWKYCDQVDVLEGEEWLPLPYSEYPNVQASSFGRIKFPNGRITEGTKAGKYKIIGLIRSGEKQTKTFLVHRLVAAAFYGRNDDPKIVVNHKDGNKGNNHAINLEYTTQKENIQHAIELGLISPSPNQFKRKVIQLDLNYNVIAEYESVVLAARQIKLKDASIRSACSGRTQTAGGYRWCYAD